MSSTEWDDPGGLAASELLGYSPAPRRRAAEARALRVNKESGCAKPMPAGVQAGKTALRTLTSGDLKRTYRLHMPTRATTTTPVPILLNFHGRTGTGIEQESYSGLVPISDRETFILVSPDGTGTPLGWSAGATPANAVDDVQFVNNLLDTLEREFCIDTARVYATGFSNGAFMASKLACTMPDRIAAIAVVGGIHYVPEGCPGRVPVLAIHGNQDDVVPMGGGTVRAWHYPGVPEAMDEWSATNGCLATTTNTELAQGVALQFYDGCAATTELIVLDRAKHVWPGASGPSAAEPAERIAGAELVWSFLATAKHPS
ncbi:MAG: PHB depolymerase family esterase [Anaerolineaceae bacterium]